jgi:putative nucleotidyltransferase with HDIG domain
MIDQITYRLKQLYSGLTAVYGEADEAFAQSYLNAEEVALFNQLPGFEKKHSVIVARKMLELALYNPELDPGKLVKLGLLHDIGKIKEHNSLLTKGILTIIRFVFPHLYDWLADQGEGRPFLRRFYIHKHHGAVGAAMLASMGESSEIVLMVKKHDPRVEPFGPEDPIELKILQQADSTI